MPAIYAHYKMGRDSIKNLNPKNQEIINKYRDLYDLGLQGADFLFFNFKDVTIKSELLATKIHYEPCRNSLNRMVRAGIDEASLSYILGFIGHFAMDSKMHPLINSLSKIGVQHHRLEMEFDKKLMHEDGIEIGAFNMKTLVPNDQYTKKVVASVYSKFDISKRKIKSSVDMMHNMKDFLYIDNDKRYKRLKIIMKMMGIYKKFGGHLLYNDKNQYDYLMKDMTYYYKQAKDIYPLLVEDFCNHIDDLNFSPYFNRTFE
ncbi:MAG: zinc dependent phospholipase C family protein [Tissierellia bacterium]|nr:zinc dependent phospholipase C family protein [Tissierellia bacterium]